MNPQVLDIHAPNLVKLLYNGSGEIVTSYLILNKLTSIDNLTNRISVLVSARLMLTRVQCWITKGRRARLSYLSRTSIFEWYVVI